MPEVPFSRRQALVGALVIVVALVVAGRLLVAGGDEGATPLEVVAEPPGGSGAANPAIVVHVVGAVRQPGLYRLKEGQRVADAVELAGGATRRADLSLVNLAAPIADGTQVVVPQRPAEVAAGGAASSPAGAATGPVHLNSATVEQLDALPGIGPVTAQKIVDWRQAHGAFTSVDDLDAVPGIGPARIEQLRELVAP